VLWCRYHKAGGSMLPTPTLQLFRKETGCNNRPFLCRTLYLYISTLHPYWFVSNHLTSILSRKIINFKIRNFCNIKAFSWQIHLPVVLKISIGNWYHYVKLSQRNRIKDKYRTNIPMSENRWHIEILSWFTGNILYKLLLEPR